MRADGTAGNDQREIIGLFHDERAMQTAVDDLFIAGFDRSSCSLLADPQVVEKHLGHGYETTAELGDEPAAPRIHYVGRDSRIEAQSLIVGAPGYLGGVLAAGIIAASGGTALAVALGTAGIGLACALLARSLPATSAGITPTIPAAQLARGGLLLWVRVKDETQERLAGEILRRHAAEDVHGHDLAALDYGQMKGGMSRSLSFMNRLGL